MKNSALKSLSTLVESESEEDDHFSLRHYFYSEESSIWPEVVHILNRALETKDDFYVLCKHFFYPAGFAGKIG